MERLPPELQSQVFQTLDPESQRRMRQVSRQWRGISEITPGEAEWVGTEKLVKKSITFEEVFKPTFRSLGKAELLLDMVVNLHNWQYNPQDYSYAQMEFNMSYRQKYEKVDVYGTIHRAFNLDVPNNMITYTVNLEGYLNESSEFIIRQGNIYVDPGRDERIIYQNLQFTIQNDGMIDGTVHDSEEYTGSFTLDRGEMTIDLPMWYYHANYDFEPGYIMVGLQKEITRQVPRRPRGSLASLFISIEKIEREWHDGTITWEKLIDLHANILTIVLHTSSGSFTYQSDPSEEDLTDDQIHWDEWKRLNIFL